jgi:hypothetical protein
LYAHLRRHQATKASSGNIGDRACVIAVARTRCDRARFSAQVVRGTPWHIRNASAPEQRINADRQGLTQISDDARRTRRWFGVVCRRRTMHAPDEPVADHLPRQSPLPLTISVHLPADLRLKLPVVRGRRAPHVEHRTQVRLRQLHALRRPTVPPTCRSGRAGTPRVPQPAKASSIQPSRQTPAGRTSAQRRSQPNAVPDRFHPGCAGWKRPVVFVASTPLAGTRAEDVGHQPLRRVSAGAALRPAPRPIARSDQTGFPFRRSTIRVAIRFAHRSIAFSASPQVPTSAFSMELPPKRLSTQAPIRLPDTESRISPSV